MSNNKVVVQGGVGFPGLLFIVLLVCKLFGANITWGLSDADVEQAIHILNDANTATKAHL